MDLKEIISISGKPGLYKIIGKRLNGLIVEAMDASKMRFPTSFTQKISILDDIAIYTLSAEVKLLEVFAKIEESGKQADAKTDNEGLKALFAAVLPDYDSERVYVSDMKKVFAWYKLLKEQGADFKAMLAASAEAESSAAAEDATTAEAPVAEVAAEPVAEEKPKAKRSKKAAPAEEGEKEEKPKTARKKKSAE